MRTVVMEEGLIYLAGDITVRAFPRERYLRIGENNFGFEFLTMFDNVGFVFEVVARSTVDGAVSCRRLEPGEIVGRKEMA